MEKPMDRKSGSEVADISAVKRVMFQELNLAWGRAKNPDWDAFASTFLPSAALFPAARPVKTQTLGHIVIHNSEPTSADA
jgi:hypothetical protein